MVLGSQSGRRNAGGVYRLGHYRKRRRGRRTVAVAVVVVLGGGYLAWSMSGGGESAPREAGSTTPEMADVSGSAGGSGGSVGSQDRSRTAGRDQAGGEAMRSGGDREPADSLTQTLETGGSDSGSASSGSSGSVESPGSGNAEDSAGSMRNPEETAAAESLERDSSSSGDARGTASGSGELRSGPEVRRLIQQGRELIEKDEPIRGRRMLSDALRADIAPADARKVRRELTELNKELIFSPKEYPDDPLTETYVVQSGDRLVAIADQFDVPHQFIARTNGVENPNRLQVGQELKVVQGPFDAVVDKEAFRLDVYLEDVFIRSFDVGLGERNSTPVGRFVVKTGSKLTNPEWTNPRTGERVLADDPENPLGEHWIGLKGTDEKTSKLEGYGIHGTIEPDTIGEEASMGCVRLAPENIELLYAMMTEGQSRVRIRE